MKILSKDAKKPQEKFFLDGLIKIYPNFPKGKIEFSESPDFLVNNNIVIYGIELVSFYRDQTEKGSKWEKVYQEQCKIGSSLLDAYKIKYGNCHYWINFFFYPNFDFYKFTETAQAEIVKQIHLRITKHSFEFVIITHEEYSIGVNITGRLLKNPNKWGILDSGFISFELKNLNNIIERKEKKINEYREKCDLIWLIIYAEGLKTHQMVSSEQIDSTLKKLQPTNFDKIIFFDYQENKYYETEF